MKSKELKLFEGIGNIDEGIINEAHGVKRNGLTAIKWVAIAACAAIIIGIASAALMIDNQSKLPIIDISNEISVGMSMEAMMVYSIDELISANPISLDNIPKKLPVYRSNISYNATHIYKGEDFEAMTELIKEYAERLGIEEYEITTDELSEEEQKRILDKYEELDSEPSEGLFDPTKVIIESEKYTLSVDVYLGVLIEFNDGYELPDGMNFTHYSTPEELNKIGEFVIEEFGYLLDMKTPTVNVHGGDRDIYGRQSHALSIFDSSGSVAEKAINFNMKSARVFPSNESSGKLRCIRLNSVINGEKLGDYPIISYEQARQMLYDGEYLSTVYYEVTSEDAIAKASLIYRSDSLPDSPAYSIPYYRFYIDINRDVDGMKTYGVYYVPAIAPEYLNEVDLWDGSMN